MNIVTVPSYNRIRDPDVALASSEDPEVSMASVAAQPIEVSSFQHSGNPEGDEKREKIRAAKLPCLSCL